MKKRVLSLTCVIIVVLYASSCIALSEAQKQEYDSLKTAVTYPSFPSRESSAMTFRLSLTPRNFWRWSRIKFHDDSYEVLQKYRLQVIPKEGYYLIEVFDPKDNSLILFSYSCETGAEGRVWEEPGKYDVNHLELYDKCKTRH